MTAEIQPPDRSLKELELEWGLSRNGLKSRARALGVPLKRLTSTLTVWPGEYIDLGNQLNEHIKAGKPMQLFPGLAPAANSAITKAANLSSTITKETTTSSLPADPFRRARSLAEAADDALVLTSDELAGIGVKGIQSFANNDLAYGYQFQKHEQRNRVLWTVRRAIARPDDSFIQPLNQQAPKRIAGFNAEILEAKFYSVSSTIELPLLIKSF